MTVAASSLTGTWPSKSATTEAINWSKLSFPHAGIYKYVVTEADGGNKATDASKAEYYMYVHVTNGTTGPEVTNVEFIQTKTDAGESITSTAKSTPVFTNQYKEYADFSVVKSVAGDYGDKTKKFAFTVTITTPDDAPAAATYNCGTYRGSKEVDKHASFTTSEHKATISDISLSDGEKFLFVSLPVGTTYTVTETNANADNYTTTYDANQNSTVPESGISTTVTNTYTPVTPTGIIINNLPYLLLIGVPLIALVAWLVVRRKKSVRA